jgi:hypothetical protein
MFVGSEPQVLKNKAWAWPKKVYDLEPESQNPPTQYNFAEAMLTRWD